MNMLKVVSIVISLFLILTLTSFVKADKPDLKIIINIPSRKLELYESTKKIKSYPIGVGKANSPTPIGNFFSVISKVKNPKWQNPYKSYTGTVINSGNSNPLGTRWIGFFRDSMGEYGIHGTNSPTSVGKYSSHGCIRMKMKDVEELFEYVELGTPVRINNCEFKVDLADNIIFITRYPPLYKGKQNHFKCINDQIKEIGISYYVMSDELSILKDIKNWERVPIGEINEKLQVTVD